MFNWLVKYLGMEAFLESGFLVRATMGKLWKMPRAEYCVGKICFREVIPEFILKRTIPYYGDFLFSFETFMFSSVDSRYVL